MTSIQLHCILVMLLVVYSKALQEELYDRTGDTKAFNQISRHTTRCTRRFTPGVCSDSVSPVWTFVYELQNCTERLGCLDSERTNRFSSYELCMFKCRELIELYIKILSNDGHNSSQDQRQRLIGNSSRRDAMEAMDIMATSSEEPQQSGVEIEELEDEPIPSMMMYRDSLDMNGDDVFPPDIDYVDGNDSG